MSDFILKFAKNGGPWGSKPTGKPKSSRPSGGEPNQPDIDDMIRSAQDRMRNMMGGGGNTNNTGSGKMISMLLILGVIVWMLSGIYIVAPDENGVVLQFGKYVRTEDKPGLKYHLPYPIETVFKPKVTRENVIEVGFHGSRQVSDILGRRFQRSVPNDRVIDNPEESLMLTGDENIVDLDFIVRWRIDDPRDYLFNVDDPIRMLKNVAESAMREVIGKHDIDNALTDNRAIIEAEAKELIQLVVNSDTKNSYKSGIIITGVEMQQVNPPQAVVDAFRDVQAARADAERMQNEAIGYANDILPRARGEVAQIMQNSEAYKASKVAEATGAAKRFESQVMEYKKAKEITKTRLYIETMESVLADTSKVIISKDASGGVLPYLPLGDLRKNGGLK